MPISEIYTGTGSATIASTSATPILNLSAPSTKRLWVVGVRVSLGVSAAAAGNSVLFQLIRPSNPTTVAGATNSYFPNDPAAPATALGLFTSPTFTTPPTAGTQIVWTQEVPQTTGSSWEEFPPLGYEYTIAVSTGLTLWATCSVGTASTVVYGEIVWSE